MQFTAAGRYNGHLHMSKTRYVRAISAALDRVWAELAASYFRFVACKLRRWCCSSNAMPHPCNPNTRPFYSGMFAQLLAGPHSRDYDTLSGRGGVYSNLYLQGVLPWANLCARHGLHCEDMGPNTSDPAKPPHIPLHISLVARFDISRSYDTGTKYVEGVSQAGSGLQSVIPLYNAMRFLNGSTSAYRCVCAA